MALLATPTSAGANLRRPSLLRQCRMSPPLPRRSQTVRRVSAFYALTKPPYELDALEPYMSKRTLELHWGKHHGKYIDKLNKQIGNSPLYGCTLEELVKLAYNNGNPYPEFNNSAQIWNHDLFWESMQPNGGGIPQEVLLQQIEKDFGSFDEFKTKFFEAGQSLYGSGWVWLAVGRKEKKLIVGTTSNAVNPLVRNDIPILALDMWEHAYYLDYKDDRLKYMEVFLDHLVSWQATEIRMFRAQAFINLGEPRIPVV